MPTHLAAIDGNRNIPMTCQEPEYSISSDRLLQLQRILKDDGFMVEGAELLSVAMRLLTIEELTDKPIPDDI